MPPLCHELSLLFLQTPILPNPSNLRTFAKKASVISRKLSTRSRISVKTIKQSDRLSNHIVKLTLSSGSNLYIPRTGSAASVSVTSEEQHQNGLGKYSYSRPKIRGRWRVMATSIRNLTFATFPMNIYPIF